MVNKVLKEYQRKKRKKIFLVIFLFLLTLFLFLVSLFVGSSKMSLEEALKALVMASSDVNNRIMWKIRIPRALAALIAGAGLSISGLIMQTTLNNEMASPATLGVSNASVFGANLALIAFAGGYLGVGSNVNNYFNNANPLETSLIAFLFAFISIMLILGLCKFRNFTPNAVVLAGVAIGAIWQAGTTLLQYFATDVGLSASVAWSFGDLARATYQTDLIMGVVVFLSFLFFFLASWQYNALLNGDGLSKSMGVRVDLLRFFSLLVASLITAICVSFLGVIGFVGIICPQIMKRLIGSDHRYLLPASLASGSVLLLFADTIGRLIGNGSSLPVGAITALIGAPFFLYIIFSKRENSRC